LLVGLAALDAVGDGGDQWARVADSSLEVEVEPLGTVGAGWGRVAAEVWDAGVAAECGGAEAGKTHCRLVVDASSTGHAAVDHAHALTVRIVAWYAGLAFIVIADIAIIWALDALSCH
jgi:hypothetical protein